VTARIRRVLETVLYCDDLATSAAFYQTLLGAPQMMTGDRLIAMEVGEGTVLLLFQRGNTGPLDTEGGLVPGHDGGGPVHLAFAIDADAMAAWEARLRELGIPIESRVRWERGGQSLYFRDPENRSVELATPGIWPAY
jgi:catechol 2,3-dioxygenase-like lactoylglutathione lyase family enzyme